MENNNKKIIINTDGGARGNPGPGAIGVVIRGAGKVLKFSKYIGHSTNNEAEYKAVILALKKSKELFSSAAELEINVDSELLYKQMRGEYRIKTAHLRPLYNEVKKLAGNFKKVEFRHIRREKNIEADALVNEELDGLRK